MNKLTINDIKVKVKLLQKSNISAQVELIIFDQIEIKGCRISPSQYLHEKFQEKIRFQLPSYRAGYQYKSIIYIADKNLYYQIEEQQHQTCHTSCEAVNAVCKVY